MRSSSSVFKFPSVASHVVRTMAILFRTDISVLSSIVQEYGCPFILDDSSSVTNFPTPSLIKLAVFVFPRVNLLRTGCPGISVFKTSTILSPVLIERFFSPMSRHNLVSKANTRAPTGSLRKPDKLLTCCCFWFRLAKEVICLAVFPCFERASFLLSKYVSQARHHGNALLSSGLFFLMSQFLNSGSVSHPD